ncbi:hypothetical protein [Nitrococcus mobilis]|uniref:Uncharacterized protein n=1 Tax=Nitrococcus mobilis Nb-231 TaxID=314278 RepID=A4BR11_9GAMM|nr:hypothetical protein [Nitrococcus mobilis]EAR22011.1 hypothetical protein NB231_06471 [Nitrococcus mobilis Nb-231]
MPTHVDHATTEVIPEPEPTRGEGTEVDTRWRNEEWWQTRAERLHRIELRTRAEGFDD